MRVEDVFNEEKVADRAGAASSARGRRTGANGGGGTADVAGATGGHGAGTAGAPGKQFLRRTPNSVALVARIKGPVMFFMDEWW